MTLWVWGAPECPYCGGRLDWTSKAGADQAWWHRDGNCAPLDEVDEVDEVDA